MVATHHRVATVFIKYKIENRKHERNQKFVKTGN